MVGGHEFLTSLPDDCWGKEITIELEATENHAFSQVKNLYIYPAASAWEYYLDIDSIGIWICVPMLFAAVLALLFQIMSLDYSSNGRKGLCIALSSLLISLWVVLSSGVQNLFGWTGYVWTQLEYIAVFCMVLPILFYVYESETGVHSKQMLRQLITVNALFVFICTVLNFPILPITAARCWLPISCHSSAESSCCAMHSSTVPAGRSPINCSLTVS
jgi:hypothetical protein